MTVKADDLRGLKGTRVRLTLTGAAGGGTLEGDVAGLLEAADGLVLFLNDRDGSPRSIHYQQIDSLERL